MFNTYYPKFRHNLVTVYDNDPHTAYLTVSHGSYKTSIEQAQEFLQMRGYCTGENTVEEIVQKSGMQIEKVQSILNSLQQANILRRTPEANEVYDERTITRTLLQACTLWQRQLEETYIAAEIYHNKVEKSIVFGWLFETYHYIKNFPAVIKAAGDNASGELKTILSEYYHQECGHEKYILECLVANGFKEKEVINSIPLVTTRLILLLMNELCTRQPCAMLLIAQLIEAGDNVNQASFADFSTTVCRNYELEADSLAGLQEHSEIDYRLGHGQLAIQNEELLYGISLEQSHQVLNSLHDIKHAFDAQALEIKSYYAKTGNYLPRQYVDYYSI